MTVKKEDAGQFFNGYAGQFDEIYMLQKQRGLVGWLNRRLRASMLIRYQRTFEALDTIEGRSVLDVGCGSGRFLVECLLRGATDVAGIDLSPEMLSLSEKAIQANNISAERAVLMNGDFQAQSFDRQYDYAIVMGVMDYIETPDAFLKKLSGVVRRKATISFPVSESVWRFQRKLRYKLRGCPLYFYTKESVDQLLKQSGFEKYSIERIQRDYFVTAWH